MKGRAVFFALSAVLVVGLNGCFSIDARLKAIGIEGTIDMSGAEKYDLAWEYRGMYPGIQCFNAYVYDEMYEGGSVESLGEGERTAVAIVYGLDFFLSLALDTALLPIDLLIWAFEPGDSLENTEKK